MNVAYTIPPLFSRAWADQMLSRRQLSRCPWVRVLYLGLLKLEHLVDSLQRKCGRQKEKNPRTLRVVQVHQRETDSLLCIPGSHCAFVPRIKDRPRQYTCG